MNNDAKLDRYHELFSDVESKAKAFDEIAACYYASNFGTMSKSDFEILLFHLYIEQILAIDDKDYNAYSDFRLAKELGITQSRVSNLKVRKHLQYPHDFDWREAFLRTSEHSFYEGGKIKIQMPDINLYYEVKNAIEERGGFIEVTLTKKLLQVPVSSFLDLLVAISPDDKKDELEKQLREELQKQFREQKKDKEYVEKATFREELAVFGKDVAQGTIIAILTQLATGSVEVGRIAENVLKVIKK